MAIYAVYAPPGAGNGDDVCERLRFVKDGPSLLALALPLVFLLRHRLWLGLVGWLAVVVGIEVAGSALSPDLALGANVLFSLWFALEARTLLGWTLERRGWRPVGVVEGDSLEVAEHRFIDHWLAHLPPSPTLPPQPVRPAGPRLQPTVIGLFPSSGDRP